MVDANHDRGLALYRSGNLEGAAEAYANVLRDRPGDFGALYARGVILAELGQGSAAAEVLDLAVAVNGDAVEARVALGQVLLGLQRPSDALASFETALRLQPALGAAHAARGDALRRVGRTADALQSYTRCIELEPQFAVAYLQRARAHLELGSSPDALRDLDQAVALRPDFAEAHEVRGAVLQSVGRAADALAAYDRAIALRPALWSAHSNRAALLANLGRLPEALASSETAIALHSDYPPAHHDRAQILCRLRRPQEALASCDRAIGLQPGYAAAHLVRGSALQDLRRPQEALASFDAAIALGAESALALSERAAALRRLERPEEALESANRALAIAPSAPAFVNRGAALHELGRHGEALASYERAVALDPSCATAYVNAAFCHLQLGQWEAGWPLYEWRHRLPGAAAVTPPTLPLWRGGPSLRGRSILVCAEQGLGDIIQFCRFVPALEARGARVVLAVPLPMQRLLRTLSLTVEIVTSPVSASNADYCCPLLSLPLALAIRVTDVAGGSPYLRPEPERIRYWRDRLAGPGLKIGVSWHGSTIREDSGTPFPLQALAPISRLPEVRLISLQKGHGTEQLRSLSPDLHVEELGAEFDAGADAFVDTSAVIENLDLVITCDTAIAHLAGALGRPAWIALKHVADWRWLWERADSPWYPQHRLFRQLRRQDWGSVFDAMCAALRQ
jgi:tetratricopeptide (TPR) repeat protein